MQANISWGLSKVLPYSLCELTVVGVGYLALVCCNKHGQNDSFFAFSTRFTLGMQGV